MLSMNDKIRCANKQKSCYMTQLVAKHPNEISSNTRMKYRQTPERNTVKHPNGIPSNTRTEYRQTPEWNTVKHPNGIPSNARMEYG